MATLDHILAEFKAAVARRFLKSASSCWKAAILCVCAFSLNFMVVAAIAAAPAYAPQDRVENLQAYFEMIHRTLYQDKNPEAAAAQFRALVPDAARLGPALKNEVAPALIPKLLELYRRQGLPDKGNIHELIRADEKVVAVHGATTEELASSAEGSPAWHYFAGGARRAAAQVLRPRMTFYQVKLTAPGQPYGMTLHLCYWDGRQWSMLGKVWQALK